MIPRTSIDEANRHLQLLHQRVHDLEITVQDQHEHLVDKDKVLQRRITEISCIKDREMEGLANKLLASERTVSILQEELERKNHHISALQHSHARLRRLLNFKDDIKDILKTMEDAEENLALDEGDTDGLLSFFHRSNDPGMMSHHIGGNAAVKKIRKKRLVRNENHLMADNGTQSDIEAAPNLAGKEFYL